MVDSWLRFTGHAARPRTLSHIPFSRHKKSRKIRQYRYMPLRIVFILMLSVNYLWRTTIMSCVISEIRVWPDIRLRLRRSSSSNSHAGQSDPSDNISERDHCRMHIDTVHKRLTLSRWVVQTVTKTSLHRLACNFQQITIVCAHVYRRAITGTRTPLNWRMATSTNTCAVNKKYTTIQITIN